MEPRVIKLRVQNIGLVPVRSSRAYPQSINSAWLGRKMASLKKPLDFSLSFFLLAKPLAFPSPSSFFPMTKTMIEVVISIWMEFHDCTMESVKKRNRSEYIFVVYLFVLVLVILTFSKLYYIIVLFVGREYFDL